MYLVKKCFNILSPMLALMALAVIAIVIGINGTAQAAPGEVLILETTVTGGLSSYEAEAVVAEGKIPVLVDAAAWSAMTEEDFASYDALVFGDKTCSTDPDTCIGPASDNADIWGPVIDGNVIIIGSDPVYHASSSPGAVRLIHQGMAFTLDEPEKTGAYICLSCYYHFSSSDTPVPLLDGISGGGFTVIGASYLPGLNDVHIVATHPALSGLTDADLSNWGNSVHEGFYTWPIDFEVLAIAKDASGSYTAPDGTIGYPYIIARGITIISDITLTPESATNPVKTSHTVTATVITDDPSPGTPVVDVEVSFEVIAGPNAGATGTSYTDDAGIATFSYIGLEEGVDTIEATFVDSVGNTQRSNRVTKEWIRIPGICGDFDNDLDVDIDDYNAFLSYFGSSPGDSNWNAEADFDGDGLVALPDFAAWYQCYMAYVSSLIPD